MPTGNPKKILIIEDRKTMSDGYQILLGKHHSYSVAANAQSAIAMLERWNYDHIFCDWHLSGGTTGLDVLRWIEENKSSQLEAFVFLCAALDKASGHGRPVLCKLEFENLKKYVETGEVPRI